MRAPSSRTILGPKTGGGRCATIACHSTRGIYEIEEFFTDRYGKALGILVQDKGSGHFTIKTVDRFSGDDLQKLYRRLNRRDPAGSDKNGNTWGGSTSIGGSPRETGSALSVVEVMEEIRLTYRPGFFRRLWATLFGRRYPPISQEGHAPADPTPELATRAPNPTTPRFPGWVAPSSGVGGTFPAHLPSTFPGHLPGGALLA